MRAHTATSGAASSQTSMLLLYVVGDSSSRRMCALHPKENMRSHNSHYNTNMYDEDDGLSSVDP